MDNHNIYIKLCRYFFLIGPVLATIFTLDSSKYPSFILLSLLIIINSQIRAAYLKNRASIVSIAAEVLLAVYITVSYGGFTYAVLFAGLLDSCTLLKDEAYPLSIFIGLCLSYTLFSRYTYEYAGVIIFFYVISALLFLGFRKELIHRTDTEALYDRISQYTYELESARARLLDYSKQVEKMAQLEERNRISQEIHDSIGHSLAGVLMQVDACMEIMKLDKEKGMEILKAVYGNVSSSIEILRQTVRKLKPPEYRPGLSAIQELIDKFAAETNINVEMKINGIPYEIAPSIETVLYHNIRETLTNSARHGHPCNIRVNLMYRQECIEVFVSDDGKGAQEIKKGLGLSGIEERLGLVGGTISFSGNNGFHIHMSIPKGGE